MIHCDPREKIERRLVCAFEPRMRQHSSRALFHDLYSFLLAHLPARIPSLARRLVFYSAEIFPLASFFLLFFLLRWCRRQSTAGEDTPLGLYALKLGDTVHCLTCCIEIVDRAADDGLD